MTDDRELHRRAGEVFEAALEVADDERRAFLDRSCGDDGALRAAVERLLDHDDDEGILRDRALDSNRAALGHLLEGDLDYVDVDDPLGSTRDRIGPYRILRRIGEGGMGVVYEAEQDAPRRRVALKVNRPVHDSDRRLRRFRREAEVLGRLEHAGIARIYQAGTFEHRGAARPYFAMEFIEGVPITTFATRAHLPLRARLTLLISVLEAVQHAHDNGVIHRDLKPDNVLVRGDGSPVVLDFGVARLSDSSTALTSLDTLNGEILGTLAYMAPEQLSGDPDAVTPRSDVYALGALAYELLAGRPPHELGGLALTAAMRVLTEREPPRLGLLEPNLAGDVETIVGKALETDPARRYASAAALAADLRAFLEHRPIVAHPPSRLYLARKFTRRHKGLVAGAATAFVAITLGLVASLVSLAGEREQRELADASAERARRGERAAIGHLYRAVQDHLDDGELWAAAQLYAVADHRGGGWDDAFLARVMPNMLPADVSSAGARWLDDERIVVPARMGGGARILAVADWTEVGRLLPSEPLASATVLPGHLVLCRPLAPFGSIVTVDARTGAVRERRPSPFSGGAPRHAPSATLDADGRLVTAYRSEDGQTIVVDRGEGASLGIDVDGREDWLPIPIAGSRFIAMRADDGRLRVHELDTGTLLGEVDGLRPSAGTYFASRRGGRALLSSDVEDRLVEVDLERREVVRRWEHIRNRPFDLFELSADERLLAQGPGARVEIWDLEREVEVWSGPVELLAGASHRVHLSPDGRRAIVGADDVIGFVLDLDRPPVDPADLGTDRDPRANTFRGHDSFVYHLALSPDGRLAASLSVSDGRLAIWDLHSLETVATRLIGEDGAHEFRRRSNLIAFDDDGRRLWFSAPQSGYGAELRCWDLLTGEVEVRAAVDGASLNPHLALLDDLLERLGPGPPKRLGRKAARLADGRGLAVQQAAGLRIPDGERWHTAPPGNSEEGLALSPDGGRVAIAAARAIRVADATSPDELYRTRGQAYAAAWAPDGRLFATAGEDGRIRLFDGELLIELYSFPAHDDYVFSLAWTPDGTRLVSTSGDATVRVWDPRTPEAREADHAGYRRRYEALRGEDSAQLTARFGEAMSVDERGAILRAALDARR
ncbi:serine/threonine-protein kinase [Engelhardtia mirabilis]|uniref:Serine/threonine-protein kinase PrkC n=1 Tax=Engelhardtia mirabilis TaxID=2528011 RepID=A0A518BS11_9BACT|nr:Serine/threonine-protein kinase PrkC [Planctomycetes bacterium Pla133]QDV04082.1 Serine/threonine-protein kinase PrkC [Planctomycetes bacterium Pla86]